MAAGAQRGTCVERRTGGDLADVVDVIVDKGLVIDTFVRVAPAGTEIMWIDGRVVMASHDAYLRFADAVNRLEHQPA
jgi:hypothetical protein